jgi:hypothetical protein
VLVIETAAGTPEELQVRDLLRRLLDQYDTGRWHYTSRVVVEQDAIAHSHPVLTLGTKFIVRTPVGALSMFLHEQLHWYLTQRWEQAKAALRDLRQLFPAVPAATAGGAQDEESTYLHLLVNWLELQVLREVAGADLADETLRQAVDGPVYGWIYRQVFEQEEAIGMVVSSHGLNACLTAAG